MKELKLETRVEVYAVGELDNIYRQLYEAAFEASKKAYAPYSKFHVGAAGGSIGEWGDTFRK